MLPRLDQELESCPALVPTPAVSVQAEGLAEWGGQGSLTLLRKGLEGVRQVHLERGKCLCPASPCPPGMGLESRLAPGGLGTLPCPAGYSGHSRAACRLSLVQEGLPGLSPPSSPQVHYGCSPAQGPGKREGILGGALGPQPSQPRILALKGMFDTEGAARPALDLDLDLATAGLL